MQIEITLPWSEDEMNSALQEARKGNADPLRALCQKEVSRFEEGLRGHPDYSDGLVKIERFAVEGYLYQKLRGHVDEKTPTNHLPEEG